MNNICERNGREQNSCTLRGAIIMQVAFLRISARVKTRECTNYEIIFLEKQRGNTWTQRIVQSSAANIFSFFIKTNKC